MGNYKSEVWKMKENCKTCYHSAGNPIGKWCPKIQNVIGKTRAGIGCQYWEDIRGDRIDHTTTGGKLDKQ